MARSILTDAERLAWERFPSDPDPDAIGIYFTLADGEIDILRRLPTPAARAEHLPSPSQRSAGWDSSPPNSTMRPVAHRGANTATLVGTRSGNVRTVRATASRWSGRTVPGPSRAKTATAG